MEIAAKLSAQDGASSSQHQVKISHQARRQFTFWKEVVVERSLYFRDKEEGILNQCSLQNGWLCVEALQSVYEFVATLNRL